MSPARLRALVVLVIAVGVVLRLPSLSVGLGMDDFAQRAMLAGQYPVARPWWDLFAFSHGDPAEVAALQHGGALPWWSHPQLRIAPLRPLSSALVWLDVRGLGDDPVWAHLHSLVWLLAMFVAAAAVFRKALPVRESMVALALLCLDDSHAYPVAWLANRSALVAATFAFVAVWAHLRWRRDGDRRGAWLAPIALTLSLSAGEYGLGAIAYLVAYELTGRAGPIRARVRALGPTVVVAIAWLVVYRLAAAGAHGSGVYVDPLADPGHAITIGVARLGALAANLVFALPIDALSLSSTGRTVQTWAGLLGLVALGVWAHRSRGATVDHPRWWLVGSVLAVLPSLGAFAATRLALLGELGMSAVLARLLVRAWDDARIGPVARRIGWGTIGAAVLVGHGMLTPWWGLQHQAALRELHTAGVVATDTLPLGEDEGPGLRVVVLAAADPMTLLYPPSIRAHAGHPPLEAWWVLSMAASEHDAVRVTADALELRPRTRAIGSGVIAQLFHRAPLSFRPGDRVDLRGMVVEVLETDAQGQVLAARFTFDRPLEDPSLRFVVSTPGGYRRYPLGPVGVPMRLAPQPPPGLQ